MEKVTGIGGFFFIAQDPQALAGWYADNLGVSLTPTSYDAEPWEQEAGTTVFQPFPQDEGLAAAAGAFHRPGQAWMLNFRVRDLDAMVRQLREAGVDVRVHDEVYPNGRFAELADPEGNPIQLWEPEDAPGAQRSTGSSEESGAAPAEIR